MINKPYKQERSIPGDFLKFSAYVKSIMPDYDSAYDIILKKKLVLGEPAIVSFLYNNKPELMFGIGSTDIEKPFIKTSINLEILNDSIIVDSSTGEKEKLGELLDYIKDNLLNKEDVVEILLNDSTFVNSIINAIFQDNHIESFVNTKLDDFKNEYLTWKFF